MYKLSVLFLLINSILCIVLLGLLFWPTEIIKPNVSQYRITGSRTVKAGEFVTYEVDACKNIDLPSIVQRSLVIEGVIYDLPSAENNVPKGCGKTDVSVQIPSILPAGKAFLSLRITYHVNVMRDQSYYFRTEEFYIIK